MFATAFPIVSWSCVFVYVRGMWICICAGEGDGLILDSETHGLCVYTYVGFPGSSVIKNLPANAEVKGSIPGLGRSPGEGNGNPLQYSRLGNPMDGGAWQATVCDVTGSQTRLSTWDTLWIVGQRVISEKWQTSLMNHTVILNWPLERVQASLQEGVTLWSRLDPSEMKRQS